MSKFLAHLRAWFLTGVIVTAPIAITIWLLVSFIAWVDRNIAYLLPHGWLQQEEFIYAIPGFGLVVAILALTVIGFLTANLVGRSLLRWGERAVERMPVVRSIYGALKQIFETILAQSSQSFRQVVLIQYPREGLWTIAFVAASTGGEVARKMDDEMMSVFIPTTPNPTSGFLLFVRRRDAVVLEMTVEEAMRYIVSVGTALPPDRNSP